jgi:hypothetical protein
MLLKCNAFLYTNSVDVSIKGTEGKALGRVEDLNNDI